MRKFLFFLLFIAISLSYIFEVDELIAKKFSFFNDLKLSYINKFISITTTFEEHFNQATTIERLTKENENLKEYKILYTSSQKQLESLKELIIGIPQELRPRIDLVKVLSYISFDDFTKVWLDKEKTNDKILGLITENYAAGIVVNKDNRAVALLNGNKECSYAVFIGESKSPGIITSPKKGEIVIKYIPIWSEIKENDEVITSGMDNIFFEGLKVGRITKITTLPDMKIATLQPYANVLKKKYFYTYEHIEENTPINSEEKK